ncbi:hypothetical protein J6590_079393 [Homalodisca vitripennis]|nr:hypothetical protein J6590_079393 [Homalodisca vitripennis]
MSQGMDRQQWTSTSQHSMEALDPRYAHQHSSKAGQRLPAQTRPTTVAQFLAFGSSQPLGPPGFWDPPPLGVPGLWGPVLWEPPASGAPVLWEPPCIRRMALG